MKEGFRVGVTPQVNPECSRSVNQARGILTVNNLNKSLEAWRAWCVWRTVINLLQLKRTMGVY